MKTSSFFRTAAIGAVLMLAAAQGRSQGLPDKQPALLNIVIERVKTGRADDHARNEAQWVAANEKANLPAPYLALSSITGPNEVWYIVPAESHAEMGKQQEAQDSNPVLSTEIARLIRADAEFIEDTRNVHFAARPDLSYGEFPNMAKARFFEIETFQVRIGHEEAFEQAVKAYAAARKKAGVKSGYRAYQSIAGVPMGTYIAISSYETFGQLDQNIPDHTATMRALSAEEKDQVAKAFKDGVLRDEANRFKVDPKQSYVSKETRAVDPAFWNGK